MNGFTVYVSSPKQCCAVSHCGSLEAHTTLPSVVVLLVELVCLLSLY